MKKIIVLLFLVGFVSAVARLDTGNIVYCGNIFGSTMDLCDPSTQINVSGTTNCSITNSCSNIVYNDNLNATIDARDNDTIYNDGWINSTLYLNSECPANQYVYNITGNIVYCSEDQSGGGGASLLPIFNEVVNGLALLNSSVASNGVNISGGEIHSDSPIILAPNNVESEPYRISYDGSYIWLNATSSDRTMFTADADAGTGFYIKHTYDSGGDAAFHLVPDDDWGRRVSFYVRDTADSVAGFNFYASSGEQIFRPYTDNAYDMGTSGGCWQDVYYYTLNDCGSPTEKFETKIEALNEIDIYSRAKLSTTTEYSSLTPEVFKTGVKGDCGQDIVNTDEVINGLVLGEAELYSRSLSHTEDIAMLYGLIQQQHDEIEYLKTQITSTSTVLSTIKE